MPAFPLSGHNGPIEPTATAPDGPDHVARYRAHNAAAEGNIRPAPPMEASPLSVQSEADASRGRRYSRRASTIVHSVTKRWSVDRADSTPINTSKRLSIDSVMALMPHSHAKRKGSRQRRASVMSRAHGIVDAVLPKEEVAPEPSFVVRPRARSSLANCPSSLALSLSLDTGGLMQGSALHADPGSPAMLFAPNFPPTPTTKEIAAGKGKLPTARTSFLPGFTDSSAAGSSSGSLAPSTPTSRRERRDSVWTKPTSKFGGYTHGGASRPVSVLAPSAPGAVEFDHTHLQPGTNLDLVPHGKTLALYRHNARKAQDPQTVYELAVFILEAAQVQDDIPMEEHQALITEALDLLRRPAYRGHVGAQFYLAECLAAGIGQSEGKAQMHEAQRMYMLAAKHGHADAAYKAGRCYENGWGCLKDNRRAIEWLRKAGSQGHPGALYRLGMAEINGELGRKSNAREGIKFIKLSCDSATAEWPHALHELALLHTRGVEGVVYLDQDYACELLARAAELGFAPSAYRMGQNYEYGRMGCPVDGGLSMHMYNIAAQQGHKDACFALTAWYMVGVPRILPQSDQEAFLWAQRAAEAGLAKAEYALGYFCENGVGTEVDVPLARIYYERAVEKGDARGSARLSQLCRSAAPSRPPAGAPSSRLHLPTPETPALLPPLQLSSTPSV